MLNEETLASYQDVRVGDFLVNPINLNYDLKSLRTALSELNVRVSPAYIVLEARGHNSPRYLRWLLHLFDVAQMKTLGAGVRQTITFRDMGNCRAFLPPASEQHRIADFLDEQTARIDALIAEKERLLDRLLELRSTTISWVVTRGPDSTKETWRTGNAFVPELPEGWALGGLTKYIGPVVDYRGKTPEKVPDGVLLVTARNIRDGTLDYFASAEFVRPEEYAEIMRRGVPEVGDVLFTTEAPLGQVANIDRTDVALAQRVVKFRGHEGVLDNYFLKYWLMGDAVQSTLRTLATGSTAEGIKASKLGQIPVAVPPLSVQHRVVRLLDDRCASIDNITRHVHEHIDRLREYRSSLISAAVTGQLDISKYQAKLPEAA